MGPPSASLHNRHRQGACHCPGNAWASMGPPRKTCIWGRLAVCTRSPTAFGSRCPLDPCMTRRALTCDREYLGCGCGRHRGRSSAMNRGPISEQTLEFLFAQRFRRSILNSPARASLSIRARTFDGKVCFCNASMVKVVAPPGRGHPRFRRSNHETRTNTEAPLSKPAPVGQQARHIDDEWHLF